MTNVHILNKGIYVFKRGMCDTHMYKSFLYWFPIAALTNLHKLSGLKQYKLIILQFCRIEVWSGSLWVETQVLAELYSESSREKSVSFSLLSLEAADIPWLMALFFCLQNEQHQAESFSHCYLSHTSSTSTTFKDPCKYIGPIWFSQESFLTVKSTD